MPFTDATSVRAVLGLPEAYDARITALIPQIESKLEAVTGRHLSEASVTDLIAGGAGVLILPRYPVSNVATVTDRQSGSVIESSNYELNGKSGMLTRLPLGDTWDQDPSPGLPRYSVAYTGGFVTVPDDIIAAGIDWIAHDLRGQGGLQSEKEGDYSYTLAIGPDGLPQSVSVITAKYRAPV
ncbi:MAG: hypothetical protein AAF479_05925 [Pseudomonadota bacterium]